MLLGCLIVLLASAGTAAVFAVEQVHSLVGAINENKSIKVAPGELAKAGFGGPQTLLLVGNDQRNHTTTAPVLPHSNEMLLVRFDPGKPWISMMSIPRELLTTIQCPNGPVTTRFNFALTCGGFSTLVATVKQVTGLSVNHVVMIDFNNFKAAVDDLGCAYSTVDRRYYHVNTPTSAQYQEINLQPGYQLMCGTQALEFVSYRHGDTSLVRDARDQSFLLSLKQQYGPTLIDNVGKFEQIFGHLVSTDHALHTSTGVLDLLGTLVSAAGDPVRQVQFRANLATTNPQAVACACVTATPGQIAASVHSFLYGRSVPHTQRTAKTAHALHHHKALAGLPLVATSSAELAQANGVAARLSFPLEYPRVQDAAGTVVPVDVRAYEIHAPGGDAYPAFVEVFSNGQLGQYYDVEGTTWTTPPLLDSPTQSVRVAGRTYYLYYAGQHLETVAWYEHHAVYWIHNTLLDSMENGELLAIAEQTATVGAVAAAAPSTAHLSDVTAPPSAAGSAADKQSTLQTIGSLGGLLTLVVAPLLLLAVLKRRREHSRLRVSLHANTLRAGEMQATLARFGAALPRSALARSGLAPVRARSGSAAARARSGRAAARAQSGLVSADPGPGSAPADPTASPVRVYSPRRRRRRRPTIALTVTGVAVLVIVAAGVDLAVGGGSGRPRAERQAARTPAVPNVPVAVLNATETEGAAATLAGQLRARKISVSEVGNVADPTPTALEILYAPGAELQADQLARLIPGKAPSIAPIDPVVQAAAGATARIAVVIG